MKWSWYTGFFTFYFLFYYFFLLGSNSSIQFAFFWVFLCPTCVIQFAIVVSRLPSLFWDLRSYVISEKLMFQLSLLSLLSLFPLFFFSLLYSSFCLAIVEFRNGFPFHFSFIYLFFNFWVSFGYMDSTFFFWWNWNWRTYFAFYKLSGYVYVLFVVPLEVFGAFI